MHTPHHSHSISGFLLAALLAGVTSGSALAGGDEAKLRQHALASQTSWSGLMVLAALFAGMSATPAAAMDGMEGHDHHHHHAAMAAQKSDVARSSAAYPVPDVKLKDAAGKEVSLRTALDTDEPVMLNFVFTTCTTICPVMSATFSQVQSQLDPKRERVKMVSISIDPEHDTPAKLKEYARKFGAGPQWQMLTGSVENSIAVQRAFNTYRGDKMNHEPATFLRAGKGKPWVRLDGFASAGELVKEYRQLMAAK